MSVANIGKLQENTAALCKTLSSPIRVDYQMIRIRPFGEVETPSLPSGVRRRMQTIRIEWQQISECDTSGWKVRHPGVKWWQPDGMAAVAGYKVAATGWNGGGGRDHWTTVRRVLKYLRGTINYGLYFSGFPSVLEGFSDANWISNSNEMKSTSGYVFILGGSAVSWKFAKKTCITRSIIEIEFIALENASSKVEWLRNILTDIPLWTRPALFVSMRCDSQVAIAKSKSKILNGKNKHICLRHNIVRQLLETKVISLEFMRCSINSNCMRVYPYGVDRAYFALIKVEYLLLMNTIFLMDGQAPQSKPVKPFNSITEEEEKKMPCPTIALRY
uniref:Retrovirus-related Pol polyprotein from transposon TNT 1-94 n=1 Tax=Vitis vinifera TaxID=29760 RepID=A5C0D1_VITVI|nr:hypothetical protein VITISV_044108 [Vitis vinifera]